jgi:hypothetical protein
MDNKKEGPKFFYGGCSPHWVNHAYLCLYCIVYLLCFISTYIYLFYLFLFYLFAIIVSLTMYGLKRKESKQSSSNWEVFQ